MKMKLHLSSNTVNQRVTGKSDECFNMMQFQLKTLHPCAVPRWRHVHTQRPLSVPTEQCFLWIILLLLFRIFLHPGSKRTDISLCHMSCMYKVACVWTMSCWVQGSLRLRLVINFPASTGTSSVSMCLVWSSAVTMACHTAEPALTLIATRLLRQSFTREWHLWHGRWSCRTDTPQQLFKARPGLSLGASSTSSSSVCECECMYVHLMYIMSWDPLERRRRGCECVEKEDQAVISPTNLIQIPLEISF